MGIWLCSPEPGGRSWTLATNTEHLCQGEYLEQTANRWLLPQGGKRKTPVKHILWVQPLQNRMGSGCCSYSCNFLLGLASASFTSFSVSKQKPFLQCWLFLGSLSLHHFNWDWQAVCPGGHELVTVGYLCVPLSQNCLHFILKVLRVCQIVPLNLAS